MSNIIEIVTDRELWLNGKNSRQIRPTYTITPDQQKELYETHYPARNLYLVHSGAAVFFVQTPHGHEFAGMLTSPFLAGTETFQLDSFYSETLKLITPLQVTAIPQQIAKSLNTIPEIRDSVAYVIRRQEKVRANQIMRFEQTSKIGRVARAILIGCELEKKFPGFRATRNFLTFIAGYYDDKTIGNRIKELEEQDLIKTSGRLPIEIINPDGLHSASLTKRDEKLV